MKMSDGQLVKTASIKARPSSQRVSAAELEQFFERQGSKKEYRSYTLNSRTKVTNRPPKVYGSVAEMKRSKASRSKIAEVAMKVHKEFFSTPDLKAEAVSNNSSNQLLRKRSISQEDVRNIQGSRHSWACTPNGYNSYLGLCDNDEYSMNYRDAWKSIEDVYDSTVPVETKDSNADIYAQTLPLTKKEKTSRASCPPPSHPPPPPPVGQVVKVDISKALGDYANVNIVDEERNSSHVMSSFRPGDSAKLYASPEVVTMVGYKSDTSSSKDNIQPRRAGGGSSLRSQSLPPKISGSKSDRGSATSSEAENSGDSGGLYSTFKKTNRQRDSLSTDSGHVSDRGTLRSLKGKSSVTSAYASKFDFEDSDAGSPQNYPTVRTPSHEPFIPEPDYESSEDDFIPTSLDKAGSLSTFGKGESSNQDEKTPSHQNKSDETQLAQLDNGAQLSPHTEAKRAIQEARERLRFSQKPIDKNATVVFISGKITEHKVEKSEIQLHRTEEGRLTGTVVISTTNEPQEPLYLSSSIIKSYENDKNVVSRYPSRDAPASEYAKYRQQILSGMNQTLCSEKESSPIKDSDVTHDKISEITDVKKESEGELRKETRPKVIDELKITLTGAQKCPIVNKESLTLKKTIDKTVISSKESKNDSTDKNFSTVTVDTCIQNEQTPVMPCSKDDVCKSKSLSLSTEINRQIQDNNQRKSYVDTERKVEKSNDIKPNICSHTDSSHKNIQKDSKSPKPIDVPSVHSEIETEKCSYDKKVVFNEPAVNINKTAQSKTKKICSENVQTLNKNFTLVTKPQTSTESSLDESLEVLRLQVNSLGLAAVNEVDVFTELVPPPPEFAASSENGSGKKEIPYSTSEIAIAPPPEFSDCTPQMRNKTSQRLSHSHQRKNFPHSCHHDATNSVDLAFLASFTNKSPNIMQMMRGDKKCSLGSSGGSINLHLPCTSGLRHIPSTITSEHTRLRDGSTNELTRLKSVQKEFRFKLLQEWTANDIADWLDSLFLPEYKQRFSEAGITGAKLANMDSNDLMGLGVKQMGHRLNMERSLKRYLK